MTEKSGDYWDEMEPFGQSNSPSPDLRLPTTIVPSFYRLKIKPNLEHSNFSGEVYITLRPNRRIKEIILHSKNLSISTNARLTEQIYEKVETIYSTRRKRDTSVEATVTLENNTTTLAPNIPTDVVKNNVTTQKPTVNQTQITTSSPNLPVDTQVTHSSLHDIRILGILEGTGDRLIILLETALRADVDYILSLSFKGNISNSLTGFYKSTYTNNNKEVK